VARVPGFRWGIVATVLLACALPATAGEPLRITNVRKARVVDLTGRVYDGAKPGTTPDQYEGFGLVVENSRNVTIRGGTFKGYRCAVLLRNCVNVTLEGLDVSGNFRQRLRSTPEREFAGDWLWPHKNDQQEWRKNYGAGICLENSRNCVIRDCKGQKQQNGILLDRCESCSVYDNDMSFNSGWGLALWRSSRNIVVRNRFDWCVRGYSHGVYDRGQDSAGILVFEQCSHNLFARNSATHSGDGFFLYAGHETLKKTGKGGCNSNRLINNDFSHAVANAIEATFSQGNWFEGNRCNDSNYGVWAGYSYETTVMGNTFEDNTIAGVAIEHGENNRILANTFSNNKRGIQLWWDDDKDLLESAFGKARPCLSRGYLIYENSFSGDGVAIDLLKTPFVVVSGNESDEVAQLLRARGDCHPFRDLGGRHPVLPQPSTIEIPGKVQPFLGAGRDRGRQFIVVGEWGPLDPAQPAVFPKRVVAWDECLFNVLGPREKVEVRIDGASAESSGRRLRVWAQHDGLHPFQGTVGVGGKVFPISGIVLRATWTVSFWEKTADPREDATVFDRKPDRTETVRKLDYRWGHDRDRFATRAMTSLPLPSGRYELRVVSDDGVRLFVDGEKVHEDWTHHAPREHKVVVTLTKGEHEFKLEHFELTGYATLQFDLRPVK
jgi:parallel beta-helix repeat protein